MEKYTWYHVSVDIKKGDHKFLKGIHDFTYRVGEKFCFHPTLIDDLRIKYNIPYKCWSVISFSPYFTGTKDEFSSIKWKMHKLINEITHKKMKHLRIN